MQILMPQIRVRKPFAGKQTYLRASCCIVAKLTIPPAAFVVLCLISAYLGLAPNKIPQYGQSDKGLHFVTFFILTVSSYNAGITCAFTSHPSAAVRELQNDRLHELDHSNQQYKHMKTQSILPNHYLTTHFPGRLLLDPRNLPPPPHPPHPPRDHRLPSNRLRNPSSTSTK